MTATAPEDDEARIDAELRETERSIEALQKKRAELLRAKEGIRWARTREAVSKASTAKPPVPASTEVALSATLERTLSSLEWTSFKKKEGEWTFLRNRDGSLVDALASETDFVDRLRKGREIVVGRYRYVVSEDKFLNRYFEA